MAIVGFSVFFYLSNNIVMVLFYYYCGGRQPEGLWRTAAESIVYICCSSSFRLGVEVNDLLLLLSICVK